MTVRKVCLSRSSTSGGAVAATLMSAPVHTEVVQVLVASAARSHSCTGPSVICLFWPGVPGTSNDIRAGYVAERGIDNQPEAAVVIADRTGLGTDEQHLSAG